MSVHEIIAELPKLSEEERELILRKLVNLDEPFEPTPLRSPLITRRENLFRGRIPLPDRCMDCAVIYSEAALADLEQITAFIAADNAEAAERFGNRLVGFG